MIDDKLYKEILEFIDNNYVENVLYETNLCDMSHPIDIEPQETFSEKLLSIIDSKKLSDSDVYNKANIDRRLFSKIRTNKDYNPSRNTALAFCVALNLNIDETEDLLERAGYALSYSNKADLIIRFFIQEKNNFTLYDIDEALLKENQKPISKY